MSTVHMDDNFWLPEGGITSPRGFRAAAVACGLKQSGRPDLVLVVSDNDCVAAGVFTRNQVAAAPVIVDRETLARSSDSIRAVVINAGNANAATGTTGLENARTMQQLAATAIGGASDQILVMSTGVIGVQLPMDRVANGIQDASSQLATNFDRPAAEAIMTTDTRPKHAAVSVSLSGGKVTIGGMAKGAGMIHPDMATLLGLMTTDAVVPADQAIELLREAVENTFNAISIDGDTSTNDTILLLANGAGGVAVRSAEDRKIFAAALQTVCHQLAMMIVRDGEGATKFVEIRVTGAQSKGEARRIAATIATSPLVKTAFFGGDPNWGRLFMAAGRSGVVFNQDRLSLSLGIDSADELSIVANGTPTGYSENAAAAIFAQPEFKIRIDLAQGAAEATMWTCDYSYDYIKINADYRT